MMMTVEKIMQVGLGGKYPWDDDGEGDYDIDKNLSINATSGIDGGVTVTGFPKIWGESICSVTWSREEVMEGKWCKYIRTNGRSYRLRAFAIVDSGIIKDIMVGCIII